MAQARGSGDPAAEETEAKTPPKGEVPDLTGISEVARKLIGLGLSGVFSTQETIRQTIGDALPKEWVDYALDTSERTRAEFLERLAGEIARSIETIDLARVMQQALEGRTLEVNARIRMLPDAGNGGRLSLSMVEDDSE